MFEEHDRPFHLPVRLFVGKKWRDLLGRFSELAQRGSVAKSEFSLSDWIFSLEIYSILKTFSMFVIDIDTSKKETKCTFMKTSFKLIVWLFLRLLRNCLRKYCLWFVFDRELENISRSEVFPCGRPLVRLVIEHLAFEDIHGWHCCTFNEFSTNDGVDINI